MNDFDALFAKATGASPYPYQRRLALAPFVPARLSVPTGLGKTAAVVFAWLWRRRFGHGVDGTDPRAVRRATPRRLVFCLPMRVLVEQTRDNVVRWLAKADCLAGAATIDAAGRVSSYDPYAAGGADDGVRVHVLLGGDVDRDWDRDVDRDAVIIGTQDMLLSRALNRGYSMSRFRWPLAFALLNQDCLWVLDEVQLMGAGLSTSAQLQAFRRKLGTSLPAHSLWMSATMREEWLRHVDVDLAHDARGELGLDEQDQARPEVAKRIAARKSAAKAPCAPDKVKDIAAFVRSVHQPATRTLVVVNTVRRAQELYRALASTGKEVPLVLLHSRFREPERAAALARLLAPPGDAGVIAVSTQVIEAGVDVSAATLVTDLAPWASLVQRFGRCNRGGELADARVFWLDVADPKKTAPYELLALEQARATIAGLSDVGPRSLPVVRHGPEHAKLTEPTHVLRERDLIELFDTTTDLAGGDIDVSRWIRETDDHDLRVFWRHVADGEAPDAAEPAPERHELCAVSVPDLRAWLDKQGRRGWRWNHLEREWQPVRPDALFPGLVVMLPAADGGYSNEEGWTGVRGDVQPLPSPPGSEESVDDDGLVLDRSWASLAEHTQAVVDATERLVQALELPQNTCTDALMTAARWHDAGKCHPAFQRALLVHGASAPGPGPWAKSPGTTLRHERPGFRHELASALAALQVGVSSLAAYLVAAHHGKVRLSIRSLPNEHVPPDSSRRFARGIWDGDELTEADLGGGVSLPPLRLDLAPMELGDGPHGQSWTARMIALRDDLNLGPFRLAFLETILRLADWRASQTQEVRHG